MRRFKLVRHEDVNGNSGTGEVAQGTEYDNGFISLTFLSEKLSLYWYQSMHNVKHLHGHGGKTKVVWIDPPAPDDEEMVEKQTNNDP